MKSESVEPLLPEGFDILGVSVRTPKEPHVPPRTHRNTFAMAGGAGR
ncbi:hypothetical protein MSIMFB_02849 [Mycobacterium simulans]|uniref:Uncharacterized protein n=1 Tax=Mycobacterium simulans TaxID=627089 RepID=A0A7Z7IKQ3_9MYCO|nr:hypothetical protein MSIMFB_02849 [Mycobacterium simulans]SON62959.1 hypothetical protein MSIMFI_04489 [Mycobacterium simulans]